MLMTGLLFSAALCSSSEQCVSPAGVGEGTCVQGGSLLQHAYRRASHVVLKYVNLNTAVFSTTGNLFGMASASLSPSFFIPEPHSVGHAGAGETIASDYLILAIGDAERFGVTSGTYSKNRATWACFGNKWGVPVRFVDPKDVPGCPKYSDWFFSRLCAMASILEAFQQDEGDGLTRGSIDLGLAKKPEWIFHVDGDTVAYNLTVALSDFIQD